MRNRFGFTLAVALVLVASSCANDSDGGSGAGEVETVHVHDILVPPDDGPVLLAAHTGLYELGDNGLVRVGERFDDLMAAAIEPDGTLIASGHPDLSSEELHVDDKPPLLGLVESEDGRAWTSRSLLGDADFHALVVRDGLLIGADSTSERVMASADGGRKWFTRAGAVQLLDLVVHPSNLDRLVGIDLDRGIVGSVDGGDTWTDHSGPALVDLAWTDRALVGLDEDGEVWRARPDDLTWTAVGSLPEGAEALGVDDTSVYAYVSPDQLMITTDDGETWRNANR